MLQGSATLPAQALSWAPGSPLQLHVFRASACSWPPSSECSKQAGITGEMPTLFSVSRRAGKPCAVLTHLNLRDPQVVPGNS